MNGNPSQWIFSNYQDMGFNCDLILQAWNQCQGNQHLLLKTILRLSPRQSYIQQTNQNPRIKRLTNRVLIKRMSRIKHVSLQFEGDKALEYLELRKLGLFSKKAFKDAKSLTLEYSGKQILRNQHLKILANHLNRGLRKLKHFSIKIEMERDWRSLVNAIPLLNSMKQTFVGLISLKLSLGKTFRFSVLECKGFSRLFAKIRATLKHLDLDFSENESADLIHSSKTLAIVIKKHLHKLETLRLNFSRTKTSKRIFWLLMSGACTHLTRLRSLDVNLEGCKIVEEDWNSHSLRNLKSNLQDLKLDFGGCEDVRLQFLTILKNDILTLCPKLQRLFICTLNCPIYSNGFYSVLEEKFLQKLNLKWFRLLYSDNIEKNLERYREMQILEMRQTLEVQKKVEEIQNRARGEEEVCLYLKALREEEQAPEERELGEQEYLQNQLFEEEMSELREQYRIQRVELEEEDLIRQGVPDFVGLTEEDCLFLKNDLQGDLYSYEGDYESIYARSREIDKIEDIIQEEHDFEDRIEEEIRFRDLTQGGRVTQIDLDYGDF